MKGISPSIFKRWVHSYEEDREDVMVYRTPDYKFPLSRGRQGFEIKENNEFIEYDIGPTDRLKRIVGRFEYEGTDRIKIYFEDPEREPVTLNIISCDGNVIRIKK
jgi:hypothetical protein